jgi:hypothetical protein
MKSTLEIIREMIDRENTMVNHRMSWFLALLGFMLAGLAFGWDKSVALCSIFSLIGIFSSLSVGLLLRCGIQTIRNLEESIEESQPVIGRGYKETLKLVHCLLPWHFLPWLFGIAWIVLMITRIVEEI